ncbi:HlyD family efflux transporter periplasmic adaptor subunit [Thermotalea metallivorans]|uniref:Membrane fusion protein n=1 Tax=Thermotalea metallivorans TaxID=520762 RepID=A0A140L5Y8_9FIRM|nr:HlyD family efflux transporter periplasmic adaptor subunit [Thermotalea metallivorans]KXG75963.1 hypothetical protein AN619_14270 [Thermotalea metallivorans]
MGKKDGKGRKKRNKFYYFFFGIVILYLLVKFIPVVMSTTIETDIVKFGNIQVVHQLNCYVIRNEKVVKSNHEGSIKYFVQDGEKVEKGYKITEIYKDTVDQTTRKKLEIINQRIESLNENKENLFEHDVQKLERDINKLIHDLKEYKEKEEFIKVEELKKELNNKLEKKRIIAGDKSFAGKNLEALKQEQQQLEMKLNHAIVTVVSPESGMISYYIDGYEEILNPMNMVAIQFEELKQRRSQVMDLRREKVISGQPLFKVVDNNVWYLVAWVEKDLVSSYKAGKKVTIKFPKDQITGEIFKVIENDENGMIIFKMDEFIEDFHRIRNIQAEAIVVNYEGLKIHNDSIIERDGKKGVFVVDVSRFARFKPIKVIGYDDAYTIIQNNIFYEKEGEDVKAVETVKLYDEVLRNASRIKEGQFVY